MKITIEPETEDDGFSWTPTLTGDLSEQTLQMDLSNTTNTFYIELPSVFDGDNDFSGFTFNSDAFGSIS
jgi:hypothetical protein